MSYFDLLLGRTAPVATIGPPKMPVFVSGRGEVALPVATPPSPSPERSFLDPLPAMSVSAVGDRPQVSEAIESKRDVGPESTPAAVVAHDLSPMQIAAPEKAVAERSIDPIVHIPTFGEAISPKPAPLQPTSRGESFSSTRPENGAPAPIRLTELPAPSPLRERVEIRTEVLRERARLTPLQSTKPPQVRPTPLINAILPVAPPPAVIAPRQKAASTLRIGTIRISVASPVSQSQSVEPIAPRKPSPAAATTSPSRSQFERSSWIGIGQG